MTVKNLIENLKQYDQDANITFILNPTKGDHKRIIDYDLEVIPELSDSIEDPEIICTLRDKTKLESITECIPKIKKKLVIEMNDNGLFVYRDGDLIREVEITDTFHNNEIMKHYPEEYMKILLRLL